MLQNGKKFLVFSFQYCLSPTAYCLLPIAYRLLPIAYRLLPIAYCLQPKYASSTVIVDKVVEVVHAQLLGNLDFLVGNGAQAGVLHADHDHRP